MDPVYLSSSYFFDTDSPNIQKLVSDIMEKYSNQKERAVAIYERVRDDWRYDPYSISLRPEHYQASAIAGRESGNCVEKSILLIAGLRAMSIPARLHLGKVKNHIAVERLVEKFGSNELTPHGMVNACIDERWLKMSPAFNRTLCKRMKVDPLVFDGENDSYLQAYNSEGSTFMEYLEDYGHFEDVPMDFMKENLQRHYPHIFAVDDTKLD